MVYIASWAPEAPNEWPASDLLELMAGTLSPKASLMAYSSFESPTGVLVPWELM